VKITKLLSFSDKIPFYFYLGCSDSSDRYSFCGKRPLAIDAVNAELPPFNNGEHNSENESALGSDITPLRTTTQQNVYSRIGNIVLVASFNNNQHIIACEK